MIPVQDPEYRVDKFPNGQAEDNLPKNQFHLSLTNHEALEHLTPVVQEIAKAW
jgi:hypothetical protein